MKIDFTWSVPDALTVTDPDLQGPLVGTRNGVAGVVVAVPWALKGVAEDGTTLVANMITPIGVADAAGDTFKPFEQVTKEDLANWLFSAPDGVGALSKLDQEQQLSKRILDAAAPPFIAKLGAPPVPPPISDTASEATPSNTNSDGESQ